MVRHKQPPSLFCLCHAWFCRYLGEKVLSGYEGVGGGLGTGTGIGNTNNNQTLSNIRLKLRPFFVEHLPVVIRTSLLEEVAQGLKAGGGDCDYGRSMLYLLNLLLSKEVKRLKVSIPTEPRNKL